MPYPTRPPTFHQALARVGLCLALAWAAAANTATGAELSVRLSAGPAPGEIVFELRNDGPNTVSVLRTDTPLAAVLSDDVFDIRAAGEASAAESAAGGRAVYVGRLYKRPAPEPGDFVELAAGESLVATIDLARYYDVPSAGDYRVDYRGTVEHAHPTTLLAGRARAHSHHGTHFRAEGPIVALKPSLVALRARPPRFNGCSAEQQSALVEATVAAEGLVGEALSSLTGLAEERRPASPRYRQWFGEYSAARYGAVGDNYVALGEALSGQTIAYDCTCTESAFAYVFPSAPYDIYMCPTFFRANLLGTDSQAGTIVHELSHFTVVAGTQDFRYGQQSVAALAGSDPDRAIGNADSYEYFAENTPALPMSGDSPAGVPNDGGLPALPLDTVGSASLASGDSMRFTVTGAASVILDSVSGDADLFVYASPSFDRDSLACASTKGAGTLDECPVPNEGTHYVAVRAYADTRFEVVARSSEGRATTPTRAAADEGTSSSGGSGGGSGAIGWVWLLVGGAVGVRRALSRPAAGVLARRTGS